MWKWIIGKFGKCEHVWRFVGNYMSDRGPRALYVCNKCDERKSVHWKNM